MCALCSGREKVLVEGEINQVSGHNVVVFSIDI